MHVTDSTKEQALMILDFIDNGPVNHEQASWWSIPGVDIASADVLKTANICGTTMCVAGTQRFLEGGVEALVELTKPDTNEKAKQKAGAALGLDTHEYKWLFLDTSTRTAREALEAIAEGDKDKFRKTYRGF